MLQLTSDEILENMFCVFCVFSSDSFFAHALENNNFLLRIIGNYAGITGESFWKFGIE